MAWKYIMFNNVLPGGTQLVYPVIFPDKLIHLDVAMRLRRLMPAFRQGELFAESAGAIEHVKALGVGGESTTLGVKSMRSDARVIELYSYAHGIR